MTPASFRAALMTVSLCLLAGPAVVASAAAQQDQPPAQSSTAGTDADLSPAQPEDSLPPLTERQVESRGIDVDQVRREIEAYLNGIDTLRADFRQMGPQGDVQQGVLKLDRPGRIRFDYDDETPLLLVSDGDTLTFIDYDVGQVTRWPIEDTPLGLLVKDDLDFSKSDLNVSIESGAQPDHWQLVAEDPDSDIPGTVEINFLRQAKDDLELLGWRVIDAQGYVTNVALNNVEHGMSFAQNTWTFQDPRGLPAQRQRRGR